MKQEISFDEFLEIESKLEIKVGRITEASSIPKSYGIKMIVDFGDGDIRSVFTNLGKIYKPEQFINFTTNFVTNLAPFEIKGVLSQAMILPPKNIYGGEEWGELLVGTKII